MAWPGIDHVRSFLYLVLLLVNNKALVRKDRSDIIFLLFSSNEEDLVLSLDRREVLGKDVRVSQRDLHSGLSVQLMDEQRLLLVAVVVQSRLDWGQDVIWLEADHIVQESPKLVSFGPDFYWWSCVSLYVLNMATNFAFEVFHVMFQIWNYVLLLQNFQKLFALVQFNQILNSLVDAILKAFELIQSLVCEIFGRWLVFLHTLEVADNLLGAWLLLINDALQVVEFLVNLLGDFVLQPLLVSNPLLHLLAFLKIVSALLLDIL